MTVGSIEMVSVNAVLDQSAGIPGELQGLSARFSNLLDATGQGNARDSVVGAPGLMSHLISKQEAVLRTGFERVQAFTAEAPLLDPSQLAARQIALSYEMSAMQVTFSGGVYLAQSAKTGLQTLMKNQ